jgi:uncharacterized membrane protein YkoI
MHIRHLAIAGALAIAAATAGAQRPTYKRDVPARLAKRAKVKESTAAAMAQRLVPAAHIQALELENEGGKLIYSFDMKTPGKDGIDEVNIDAITGKRVGKIGHESSASEAREAATEGKAAKKGKAKADTGRGGGKSR